jgi:hypothetical protein
MKRWLDEHSLSLVLFALYVLSFVMVSRLEVGTFWYDRVTQIEGASFSNFMFLQLARCFWERDADPTRKT